MYSPSALMANSIFLRGKPISISCRMTSAVGVASGHDLRMRCVRSRGVAGGDRYREWWEDSCCLTGRGSSGSGLLAHAARYWHTARAATWKGEWIIIHERVNEEHTTWFQHARIKLFVIIQYQCQFRSNMLCSGMFNLGQIWHTRFYQVYFKRLALVNKLNINLPETKIVTTTNVYSSQSFLQ